MRILVLHSRYLSGAVSGENRIVDDEVRLLRDGGHEVALYSPDRLAATAFGPLREGVGAVWSREAVGQVGELVRRAQAEIVHCHNMFPSLSPAVLKAAHDGGASVVMALQNYRLHCLNATFLREGHVCEDCLGRVPWRGVHHRCYRDSAAGSASLAISLTLHRLLRSFDRVTLYLAASQFVMAKHVQAGVPAGRIIVKPNFAWSVPRRRGPGEYFLYAGRLSREKDVATVLAAWRGLDAPLVIVGDGPDGEKLMLAAPGGVEFRGARAPEEIPAIVAQARALIIPSLSYEGAPRTVVEAYAAGVPVLANAVGALPELVEEGVSGLLVPPSDPSALVAAVKRMSDDTESERLGEGAWAAWKHLYTPQQGLEALEDAYRLARSDREPE